MLLSQRVIKKITPKPGLIMPGEQLFSLPEKVLQFGTGVLLRGLPDYFIDKANRNGEFNGRIVVVKSTAQGSSDAFEKQDGLYTLFVKGIENGAMTEEAIINSSISRVLSATSQWHQVLECARSPELKIIISNTTEVGIVLTDDDISLSPPSSYPGKLLAFLYERYRAFYGREDSGMVIIPTELILNNGDKLRSIVVELAAKNNLEQAFIQWLQSSNHFCNSLVDRIVPGKFSDRERTAIEQDLGYEDELMIMAEPFRLWAIESASERVKEVLSFTKSDDGAVIVPDIEKFRELKLRLLNGTHSFVCGLALLSGFDNVKEAMLNETFATFVRRLMLLEIAPVLDGELITYNEACAFADKVIDRFRNPALDHKWINIATNYSSKMKMRNVQLLLRYHKKFGKAPAHMAAGLAGYLQFMDCKAGPSQEYVSNINGRSYPVQDEMAAYFSEQWKHGNMDNFVDTVLANEELWGSDLTKLDGLSSAVKENLAQMKTSGVPAVIAGKQIKTIA